MWDAQDAHTLSNHLAGRGEGINKCLWVDALAFPWRGNLWDIAGIDFTEECGTGHAQFLNGFTCGVKLFAHLLSNLTRVFLSSYTTIKSIKVARYKVSKVA